MPSSQFNRRIEIPVRLALALEDEASAAGVSSTALARAMLREALLYVRLQRLGQGDSSVIALAEGDHREWDAHQWLIEHGAVVKVQGRVVTGWVHGGQLGAARPRE